MVGTATASSCTAVRGPLDPEPPERVPRARSGQGSSAFGLAALAHPRTPVRHATGTTGTRQPACSCDPRQPLEGLRAQSHADLPGSCVPRRGGAACPTRLTPALHAGRGSPSRPSAARAKRCLDGETRRATGGTLPQEPLTERQRGRLHGSEDRRGAPRRTEPEGHTSRQPQMRHLTHEPLLHSRSLQPVSGAASP